MLYLNARYLPSSTPQDVPCTEDNLHLREIKMPFHTGECALILVDVWNAHYIESLTSRQNQIIQEVIVPVLGAARRAGIVVIHAPGPDVAKSEHIPQPSWFLPGWPPVPFCNREKEYVIYRPPPVQQPHYITRWEPIRQTLAIHPLVKPLPEEPILASGTELHYRLLERRVLHLFYVGFATNMCILERTYGIRRMSQAGYNTILIRDATTAVESADTIDGMLATKMAIREVEHRHGFTVASADFIAACNRDAGET